MSSMKVCVLFRPLNSKELSEFGDAVSVQGINSDSFIIKDEKEQEFEFTFDRVFYQGSEQADIYEFLALPIVQGAVDAINGTIITYGQTGAGKTYSMEGPSIVDCENKKKGLLQRVVDGLFDAIVNSEKPSKYTIKLSMVEIYMEKVRFESLSLVPEEISRFISIAITQHRFIHKHAFKLSISLRDLFDLSKDNIQIKESKVHGIILNGATEVAISNSTEALQSLSVRENETMHFHMRHFTHFGSDMLFMLQSGIANRAVGETQMNMSSSRSHCLYIFTVQQDFAKDKRTKFGKLILADLAGSEKVEKTGAEGKILEEAKTINQSLTALGKVINAMTSCTPGKPTHIPYRDSKLTRILQDALGGCSQTALLCCCSPSPFNSSESLSTLRFGARAKHIKASVHVSCKEDLDCNKAIAVYTNVDESRERILGKLRETMTAEDVQLLEKLFVLEGIFFDPNSVDEIEAAYEDVTSRTISSLHKAVEELSTGVEKMKRENAALKARLKASEEFYRRQLEIRPLCLIL
ncbi:Kinesin-1-like protein PSS1 [Capsicum annuum]|uniref:kinesin-like protein KIN-1 isoform X2 n=1 Tax=Capsicum annuum TaxID=4072 RepID=UPI001FB0E3C9|nr:kinesin-like protein KIN-1 isoform X2 [Capsicum annuum]KAF3656961.1 Kinesin-1-like protein PSS1 [Capsicum annuum]